MKINKRLVVTINGFPQKIHLWGTNPNNPIILFIHGGPGNPFRHQIRKHLLPLTDAYTLAAYDQRGAGGSYRKMDPKDLHPEDYVKDIEGWAEWLCGRYHQKQVYLVGESWGSFIGSIALLDKPELFKAYIGYGQVVDMKAALKIQYDETLAAVRARGLKDKEEKLLAIGEPVDGDFKAKNGLGIFYPIMYQVLEDANLPSFMKREILPFYFSIEYSLQDKIGWAKGKELLDSSRPYWGENMPSLYDFHDFKLHYQMPYYVFQGHDDFICPWQQIPEYLDRLTAPKKGYLFIEKGRHTWPFDYPERFMEELRKVFR